MYFLPAWKYGNGSKKKQISVNLISLCVIELADSPSAEIRYAMGISLPELLPRKVGDDDTKATILEK